VVFRDGLPAALIDSGLARPATRLYDIADALWSWGAAEMGRSAGPGARAGGRRHPPPGRYHEDSRAPAELDPVWRKLWEDGAKDTLPRAEAWLREAAPAITARLCPPG
jgi:hypothetical protein